MWLKDLNRRVRMFGEVTWGWEKFLRILAIKPWTMVGYRRLSVLYDLMEEVERNDVPGSIVVCGAWEGGSAALLSRSGRATWVFDSWEGLPEPTEHDVKNNGKRGKKGMDLASVNRAREVMRKYGKGLWRTQKGWFSDTIPPKKSMLTPIAFIHLDADWYESTRFVLEELWDRVSPGGIVAIDDYGCWQGCKKAADEFCEPRGIQIIRSAESMAYIRKV